MSNIVAFFVGVGQFLESNAGTITALSTLIVAAFTVVLAISTRKLWIEARRSGDTAEKSANAAMLQARASVAAQLPVVAWGRAKLVEFNAQNQPIRDPIHTGQIPQLCRPVFEFHNTGPTRILLLYCAMKWEIVNEVAAEPNFGGMRPESRVIMPEQSYAITTDEAIELTDQQRVELERGGVRLWAYGFIRFNDFMDEAHQLGMIAKWDPPRGFVVVMRDNYSYVKSEKTYTRQE